MIENVIYLLEHEDKSVSGPELIAMLAGASKHAAESLKPLFVRVRAIALGTPLTPPAETPEA